MEKADEYREYAAECVRLAMRARSDASKTRLLEMSKRWLDLAALAERAIQREDDFAASGSIKRHLHS
jgi:hypothetical protein